MSNQHLISKCAVFFLRARYTIAISLGRVFMFIDFFGGDIPQHGGGGEGGRCVASGLYI